MKRGELKDIIKGNLFFGNIRGGVKVLHPY